MISNFSTGLEDGAEHFDRLDNIFTKICSKVGKEQFYASAWHCVLSQSPARLSAVQLVTRHFDKKQPTAYQSHVLGTDHDLVVSELCFSKQRYFTLFVAYFLQLFQDN